MTISLLKKLALIAVIPVCLTLSFEYPSFSKNYTQSQKFSENKKNHILKLNKPQYIKDTNLSDQNDQIKNGIKLSEDGCIIKNLRLRNGMSLQIKQNCH
jgi:adenosine deaminase